MVASLAICSIEVTSYRSFVDLSGERPVMPHIEKDVKQSNAVRNARKEELMNRRPQSSDRVHADRTGNSGFGTTKRTLVSKPQEISSCAIYDRIQPTGCGRCGIAFHRGWYPRWPKLQGAASATLSAAPGGPNPKAPGSAGGYLPANSTARVSAFESPSRIGNPPCVLACAVR
jgi:hypothetical protein